MERKLSLKDRILSILLMGGKPLEYKDVAEILDESPESVRVVLHIMRDRGTVEKSLSVEGHWFFRSDKP